MNKIIIDKTVSEDVNRMLLNWYKTHKRSLPFRESKNAYYIWISEIMAQQTQIKTIIPYFNRFIEVFPDVETLAKAEIEEVYRYWEGLGYYSRAKNLKKAAEIISTDGFPESFAELKKLPGIGPYTAGAIASIAFDERVPAIDGNVIRVISRIYGAEIDFSKTKNKNQLFAELTETMPSESGSYNQSLMELGAVVCTPQKPSCLLCPVRAHCVAYNTNTIDKLPLKKKSIKKTVIYNEALIIVKDGLIMYQKRDSHGLLANMYGFPIIESELKDERDKKTTKVNRGASVKKLAEKFRTTDPTYLGHSRHVFTHLIWETDVFVAQAKSELDDFTSAPSSIATAFKKMEQLL